MLHFGSSIQEGKKEEVNHNESIIEREIRLQQEREKEIASLRQLTTPRSGPEQPQPQQAEVCNSHIFSQLGDTVQMMTVLDKNPHLNFCMRSLLIGLLVYRKHNVLFFFCLIVNAMLLSSPMLKILNVHFLEAQLNSIDFT